MRDEPTIQMNALPIKLKKLIVGLYIGKILITSKLKYFQTLISKYFMLCAELKPEVYLT